jgi:flagellar protein FliJ
MARFVFRLAPVLRQRERIEEQKKLLFAREQRVLADAEARREMLRGKRESLALELILEHRKLDFEGLRLAYAHLDFLAREITAADWHVAACQQALERAREVLVRATKDRKILDRLQERQRDAFKREEFRREQRELDDDNARRYSRSAQSAHHQGV